MHSEEETMRQSNTTPISTTNFHDDPDLHRMNDEGPVAERREPSYDEPRSVQVAERRPATT